MNLTNFLLILSTLCGPILAVQTQKFLERYYESRNRKLWIFHTLMTTIGSSTSDIHVEALNTIIFYYNEKKKSEREVIHAWREYQNLLNDQKMNSAIWLEKRAELFTNLLYKMSQSLGYNFDKIDIQHSCYIPKIHTERETIIQKIHYNLADILSGNLPLRIKIDGFTDNEQHNDNKS